MILLGEVRCAWELGAFLYASFWCAFCGVLCGMVCGEVCIFFLMRRHYWCRSFQGLDWHWFVCWRWFVCVVFFLEDCGRSAFLVDSLYAASSFDFVVYDPFVLFRCTAGLIISGEDQAICRESGIG